MRLVKRERSERVLPVEITPMIDVVFLMIIFFMTTAQFARLTRAELDLPVEPGEQQPSDEAGLVINITPDDRLIVNDRQVTLDELAGLVAAELDEQDDVKLLLRADRNATAALLNDTVAMLREAGVAAANVATEVP